MVRFNDSLENKLVLCTRHSPIPAGTMKILLHDPDIIGFQEVRSRDGTMETNQLNDLASLLPEYPFSFYAKASDVTGGEGIEEGIALLRSVSRFKSSVTFLVSILCILYCYLPYASQQASNRHYYHSKVFNTARQPRFKSASRDSSHDKHSRWACGCLCHALLVRQTYAMP
jgi:hypothetical protein